MSDSIESQPRSRRPLWILSLLFFVPLAIAFALYYGGSWRPANSIEHGNLIHPARPLPEVALTTADGGATAPTFLQAHWSLLFIGDGRCTERCRAALADMERARTMLGKDIGRVQSVFLASSACCDSEYFRTSFPAITVARVDDVSGASLLVAFPLYDNVPIAAAGRIYIVDPLGNLMMSYAPDASSIGLYEDLKQLLKLSHIG